MMFLTRRLNALGVYESLDFALWGSTYEQGGVIEINCDLYSDKAQEFAEIIESTKIDLGESGENVAKALMSIAAELKFHLRIGDSGKILKELAWLDEQPWIKLDDIDIVDTRECARSRKLIYATSYEAAKPKKVNLVAQFDNGMNRELIPLFYLLSRFVLLTMGSYLSNRTGYYRGEIHYSAKKGITMGEMMVSPQHLGLIDVRKDARAASAELQRMLSKDTKNRFLLLLRNFTYKNDELLKAPDTEKLITQSGFYVGPAGWRRLATDENLAYVIENMTLEIAFGRIVEAVHIPVDKGLPKEPVSRR